MSRPKIKSNQIDPAISGGTKTLGIWTTDQMADGTVAPTTTTRNGFKIKRFADAAGNSVRMYGKVPEAVTFSTGVSVIVTWTGENSGSGNCVWTATFDRYDEDIDILTGGSANQFIDSPDVTIGKPKDTTLSIASAYDSLVAGSSFRLTLTRIGTDVADTMTGGADVFAFELRKN